MSAEPRRTCDCSSYQLADHTDTPRGNALRVKEIEGRFNIESRQ